MNDKTPFPPDSYSDLGLDQLVTYAVKSILDIGEECTFERLVFEAFTLFPKKFGFQRYPEWPDSARINKAWLRSRTDKGWITGSVKAGFILTPAGEMVANDIERQLGGKKKKKKTKVSEKTRERYEAVIKRLRDSDIFNQFSAAGNFEPKDTDLIQVLGGTLETPTRILRHNLNLYYEAAKVYKDKQLASFLDLCREWLKARGT